MELARWQQIDNILLAALEVDPAERISFIEQACAGDDSLREEVISLLSFDEQALDIIETPVLESAACILTSDQPDLDEGQYVGHYRIVSFLGAGGMGEVYLAEDTKLGRRIALKLLPSDFTKDRDQVRRFQQEARSASALNHPNIITIHETEEFQDRHFIATEFIEGETLRQRIRNTALDLGETLDIAIQVGSALAAAHQAGIIHRDIKPENIMLRPDGYVKVLDFGLAKLVEQSVISGDAEASSMDEITTRAGLIMGTVKYMSPEQARGVDIDARSDIFSLGVVVYEMVTGHTPFEGETPSDTIASILKVEPPPLAEHSPEVPEELQSIITKALHKEKAERYQTIKEMLADLKNLKQQLELESKIPPAYPHSSGASRAQRALGYFKYHKVAVIAVGLVLIAAAGWLVKERLFGPGAKPLPFNERDWVLITNFENRTGEEVFDGALEYAFERELGNSQYVNVAPRERIEDALRLMKKPIDARIDAAIGREICLRDGAIRAIIAGRAEKLGATYILSVSLVDPSTSNSVANSTEEASSQQQVSAAVRRLSSWLRETLGESLSSVRQSDLELEKVTTPSLRALQLYTQGESLGRQLKWPVAEQIFRQALAEDPEFASAHMMYAWSLFNQRKPEDEWKPPSDRALEFSERVSERERYFIQGSYYSIRRQDDIAIPIYEALLQRYPDHYWGLNNLRSAYRRLNRIHEALPYDIQRADLRPNDFMTQANTASTAYELNGWDEAMPYIKRANGLISPELTKKHPYAVAWVQFASTMEHYLRGDLETALAEGEGLVQTVASRSGEERNAFALWAYNFYLWFGKLKAAEEFARLQSPERNRYFSLATIAFERNDRDSERRKYLLDHLRYSESKYRPDGAALLIMAGLLAEAKKVMSNTTMKDQGYVNLCQGEFALAQGQTAQAISLLQQGIESIQSRGHQGYLNWGRTSLAAAYERQGDLSSSLRVLEEAIRENKHSITASGNGLKNKVRLAQLYRELGRVEDAQRIEAELLHKLTYADEDHPILLQLKHSKPN